MLGVPTWTLLGSFPIAYPGGLHALIRAGRKGDVDAVAAILAVVRSAPPEAWPPVTSGIVVPVPGHLPGPPDRLVVAATELIGDVRGWQVCGDALRRDAAAPEAKTGAPRDAAREAATLVWQAPHPGRFVVLVDDVVRTGATLRACASAIRASGDARPVIAIALARAVDAAGSGHRSETERSFDMLDRPGGLDRPVVDNRTAVVDN